MIASSPLKNNLFLIIITITLLVLMVGKEMVLQTFFIRVILRQLIVVRYGLQIWD